MRKTFLERCALTTWWAPARTDVCKRAADIVRHEARIRAREIRGNRQEAIGLVVDRLLARNRARESRHGYWQGLPSA